MNAYSLIGRSTAARRLCVALVISSLAALTGCPPAPTPTPAESALAGTWVFLTSAVDTEITQFSVIVDDAGNATSVTYQLGTAEATTTATAGSAGLSGAIATVNFTFGDNSFMMSGTLDGSLTSIAGFASLRLQVPPVTITLARALGTLTRTTGLPADPTSLAGTWTLSVPSTQLFQSLLGFDTLAKPTLVSTKIGSNLTRTDIAPGGSATATTDSVDFNVTSQGAVSAQDNFVFTGQFNDNLDVLNGTASVRVSAAETTIVIQNVAATLVKATPPSSGTLSLRGTWDLQALATGTPAPSPVVTALRLQFNSSNLVSVLTYTIDNGTPVTIPGSAAQTQFDGAFVTVKAASASDSFQFNGAIDTEQTALLGYMTAQLGGASVSQQAAIFVKQ